eukprot:145145_1
MSDSVSRPRKKARKQVHEPLQSEEPGRNYNIWYHKNPKKREDYGLKRSKAPTRCVLSRDAGETKAAEGAYLCIHFIRGQCCLGENCRYLHRLPTLDEIQLVSETKDVFGRDKYSTERDDMGGVGSFSKQNRTLYVGQLSGKATNLKKLVRAQFSEWGEIEDVHIVLVRSIAFVRFKLRVSAEIAKEAMNGQEMGFGEILNVRWAYDDPNPRAIARKKCQEQKYASDKIAERVASLRQCGPRLPTEYTSELLSAPTIAQRGPRLPTEYTSELLSTPTIAQCGPRLPTEYTSELLSAPTIAQCGPRLPTEYTSELLSAPTIAQRGPHLPTEYTSELLSAPTIAQCGPRLPTEYTSELLSTIAQPTIAQCGPTRTSSSNGIHQ